MVLSIINIYGLYHGFAYQYVIGGDWNMELFYFPFHTWDVILPIDSYFSEGWVYHQPVMISPQLKNDGPLISSVGSLTGASGPVLSGPT